MGHEADYPIWFAHAYAASCWLFLTAVIQTGRSLRPRKRVFRFVVLWRSASGKSDGSNSDAEASTEVDAVREGEFETEPAA